MNRTRRKWSREEDATLRKVVNESLSESKPLLWRELAKKIPGRSNKDCRRRWWNSLADGTAKGLWSDKEDSKLLSAVRELGTSWRLVAQHVGSRTPDQCASHWTQVLDPGINHCEWTESEDGKLFEEVMMHGTNWTTIASFHSPKRTTLALKNRYATLRVKNADKRTKKTKKNSVCVKQEPMASSLSLATVTDRTVEKTSPRAPRSVLPSPRTDSDGDGDSQEADILMHDQSGHAKNADAARKEDSGAVPAAAAAASPTAVVPTAPFHTLGDDMETLMWPGMFSQTAFDDSSSLAVALKTDEDRGRKGDRHNTDGAFCGVGINSNSNHRALITTVSPELVFPPLDTYGYFTPLDETIDYSWIWSDMQTPISPDAPRFLMCDSPATTAVPRSFGYSEQVETGIVSAHCKQQQHQPSAAMNCTLSGGLVTRPMVSGTGCTAGEDGSEEL